MGVGSVGKDEFVLDLYPISIPATNYLSFVSIL